MYTLKDRNDRELTGMLGDVITLRAQMAGTDALQVGLHTLQQMLSEEQLRRAGTPSKVSVCDPASLHALLISAEAARTNHLMLRDFQSAVDVALDLMFALLYAMIFEVALGRVPEESREWKVDDVMAAFLNPGCGMCPSCIANDDLLAQAMKDLTDAAVVELHVDRVSQMRPIAQA
jgi:hypothetical protein